MPALPSTACQMACSSASRPFTGATYTGSAAAQSCSGSATRSTASPTNSVGISSSVVITDGSMCSGSRLRSSGASAAPSSLLGVTYACGRRGVRCHAALALCLPRPRSNMPMSSAPDFQYAIPALLLEQQGSGVHACEEHAARPP